MDVQRDGNREARGQRGQAATERGQTTLDFAIGMSLFLAVLIFIFLFVPGLLAPFTAGGQEETVSSNRVADYLAKGALGTPRDPFVLDTQCTILFFDNQTAADKCGGDWSGDMPVEETMGLDPARQNLNVTIRGTAPNSGEEEILCWDEDDNVLVGISHGTCGTTPGDPDVPFTRGDTPPDANDATVTALRVASLKGTDVTVYVEMW
ncbi:hypothetical protein ACFQGE_13790 [Halomicroarcula sp. GCM10025817]|uniref:DUF7287 family protein n=1 Tax=Haloarcula TaxID=2237 RepID=UPI0023E8B8BD|nr:hypothetical protein [Halomicroarcula sp. SYNS111]